MSRPFYLLLRKFLLLSAFTAAGVMVGAVRTSQSWALEVRVVPEGVSSGLCGSDWPVACSLQHALQTVAQSGDEIWVATGQYTPGSARTDRFRLRSGVALYGGFSRTETSRDQRDWAANPTVLSGDIGAPAVSSDNSYQVVDASGTDATAILDGFNVTGGNAVGYGSGAGIFNNGGSPMIRNCEISGNSSIAGGGMYNHLGAPTIESCVFSGNTAQDGGAMYNSTSSPVIRDSRFEWNAAQDGWNNGGGIFNWDGTPFISSCTFLGNSAADGGGMYSTGSRLLVVGCTFSGNEASSEGGGMFQEGGTSQIANCTFGENAADAGGAVANYFSTVSVVHSTFLGNTANDWFGGGAIRSGRSNLSVGNSILWGNVPDQVNADHAFVTGSIHEEDCLPGVVCDDVLHENPRLGRFGDYGGAARTYPLLYGSPAIDGADPALCGADPVRYSSQNGLRRGERKCDIGAFELGQMVFRAVDDGWVLESAERSNIGARVARTGTRLLVGDDSGDRQYRSILSFDTSGLPDTAAIMSAELQVEPAGVTGDSPFATHGKLLYDIKSGYFSTSPDLQRHDFEAPPSAAAVGTIADRLESDWYVSRISGAGLDYINREGLTQFRLRFARDDDDDHVADCLAIYSNNSGTFRSPRLKVGYFVR